MCNKWYIDHGYKLYYDTLNDIYFWSFPECITDAKRYINMEV